MRTHSPLFLLGAAGLLSTLACTATAQVDTSQWKCETCPFEKSGLAGTLDAGVNWVSDPSPKFGDYSGLQRRGLYLAGAADVRYRDGDGTFGNLLASTDAGAIKAEIGREGRYSLKAGYAELPHRLSESATTPFLGAGSGNLTLPAGFPTASNDASLLTATLAPIDLGFTRTRYDASLSLPSGERWTHRLSVQRDVRDGTQRISGSFFANAAQLVAPIHQTTDQFELATNYNGRRWQASLAYQASVFHNDNESLTWSNPFSTLSSLPGASMNRGQLALAPDNLFHQIRATAGYQVLPQVRASADIAVGRMSQNAAYVPATLNAYDALNNPSGLQVAALPANSANAIADTVNGSFRLAIAATDRLRINASYARDVRQNKTASLAYPAVEADVFLGAQPRYNQPYTFKQDRYKLEADYRGARGLKASAGLQEDDRERSLQDTVKTRDASVWGRVGMQVMPALSLTANLAYADRSNSGYGSANWVSPAENLLMRRFNQADRKRNTVGLRADITASENVTIGLNANYARDRYPGSAIGLDEARSISFGGDLSVAVSDDTQLQAYAQGERLRSGEAGSQLATLPNWQGRSDDAVDVLGLGIKHSALKGKLDLTADFSYSRSRSDVTVMAGSGDPAFPTATTAMDSVKLQATYQLRDNLWLSGSYWYEFYESHDWHLDGVLPATVSNLLTLGDQSPRYRVNVIRMGVRYRF